MKKLLYIFLGLSLIFACSDDSDENDSNNNNQSCDNQPSLQTNQTSQISINYDGNSLWQGAIIGTDVNWDFPSSDTTRVTALIAGNYKVRIT